MGAAGGAGPVRILGIDPGSRLCGYGVVDIAPGQKPRYVECGVLQLKETSPLPFRLRQLHDDLGEVIAELRPDEMSLEAIFHGKNAQSALRLGYARGVVMLLAEQRGLRLHEYPPATVKRAVAGNGRAAKEEVQRMVRWLCGLRHTPQADAADALALALCHAYRASVPAALRAAMPGRPGGSIPGRIARQRRKPA
jgi:crossover junction endodeoxyribonuclease RuvC